jgi:hypothetical protein
MKEFIAKRNHIHNFKATSNKVTLTRILNFCPPQMMAP